MRVPKVTKNPYIFDPKTDKVVWRKPTPITRNTRFTYQSEIDPAVIIHSSKTHRTVSEAFRDADYATPIWRCETDFDRTMGYIGWIGMWVGLLGVMYLLGTWFAKVMP